MKKNYFLLAAATMMLAACAETDLVNEVQESAPVAIDFDTFANKATRAATDLGDHHENFAVWGYKNTASDYVFGTSTTVGVTVEADGTYTPKKYWDKAATTYEFYAAAPKTADWTLNANTNAQNDDYFTLADFTLTGACLGIVSGATPTPASSFISTADVDLMIARTANVTNFSNPVELTFNHILSRLNITVKKGSTLTTDGAALELTSISVNNLVSNGSFDGSKTGADRWGAATTPAAYNINGQTTTVADDTTYYVFQALVIPQDVAYEDLERDGSNVSTSKPYLQINYIIGGEAYSATYNLASAFGSTSAAVSFLEGKQNTLNITIDADEIVFTASTADWAAGQSDEI